MLHLHLKVDLITTGEKPWQIESKPLVLARFLLEKCKNHACLPLAWTKLY
jgi:hypothetical protein